VSIGRQGPAEAGSALLLGSSVGCRDSGSLGHRSATGGNVGSFVLRTRRSQQRRLRRVPRRSSLPATPRIERRAARPRARWPARLAGDL